MFDDMEGTPIAARRHGRWIGPLPQRSNAQIVPVEIGEALGMPVRLAGPAEKAADQPVAVHRVERKCIDVDDEISCQQQRDRDARRPYPRPSMATVTPGMVCGEALAFPSNHPPVDAHRQQDEKERREERTGHRACDVRGDPFPVGCLALCRCRAAFAEDPVHRTTSDQQQTKYRLQVVKDRRPDQHDRRQHHPGQRCDEVPSALARPNHSRSISPFGDLL